MATEEQEASGIAGVAEVDHHHAVLGGLHEGLDVTSHEDFLVVRQVTDKHGVLDARAVALNAPGDITEPAVITNVVGDEVTTPSHGNPYLVTSGE